MRRMTFWKKWIIRISALMGIAFVLLSIHAKIKKKDTVYTHLPEEKNPMEGKTVVFIEEESDPVNADGVRGHLEAIGESGFRESFYTRRVKRTIDLLLSFFALIFLSPLFLALSLAIVIDDPGPVFFTQKRVGKNKQYFQLHKFRSMKMSTPHDTPTHMLKNPEQYITRVGKFIRAHSLDELPQIWDIFVGNMSFIGPRPGLWNQDCLIAERDKYHANDVMPGLSGLAQISGRDELEISEKAKIDGEYVEKIGFLMDMRCFFGTIFSVLRKDGVVEGGTGATKNLCYKENSKKEKSCSVLSEISGREEKCEHLIAPIKTMAVHKNLQGFGTREFTKGKSRKELIGNIGFGESVEVDKHLYRKVLITGAGSYIGCSFKQYAQEYYPENFSIDELSLRDESWKEKNFSDYDVVYHVAGIAHADVGKVLEKTKEKYYQINTDLSIAVAKKAKEEGVKCFVFMSSMIVYGDSAPVGKKKIIDENTVPIPANFYGDSKLQADVAVRELADDKFKVIVLRPPMIYGRGSKGNYSLLAKLAKLSPIFPDVKNERSMLYIENLCELLCQAFLLKSFKRNAVVLLPQNKEWVKTAEMVEKIAVVNGKEIITMKSLRPVLFFGGKVPGKIGGLINKAFGNNCYTAKFSCYEGLDYQKYGLAESVRKSEHIGIKKKKVLFLANHDLVIYNFRLELVERLLSESYEVHISAPFGDRIAKLKELGCVCHEIKLERHGMNPIRELGILFEYRKLIDRIKPDIVLGFTIKPNIYGAIVARERSVPFIANITGLGTAVENSGLLQRIILVLYRVAFRQVQIVFFQNEENRQFFLNHGLAMKNRLLPGSGVNLNRFPIRDYPDDKVIRFAFISRIMKEKGIEQYLEAAKIIKQKYANTEFHICGFCEKEYTGMLEEFVKDRIVNYHGMENEISLFLGKIHCVVHPTYYPEGLSNVLLEACASGRPIITTNRSGCKEVVEDGINGYVVKQQDTQDLIRIIEKFLKLSHQEKAELGISGRRKVERLFDRQIVVDAYMSEINGV